MSENNEVVKDENKKSEAAEAIDKLPETANPKVKRGTTTGRPGRAGWAER